MAQPILAARLFLAELSGACEAVSTVSESSMERLAHCRPELWGIQRALGFPVRPLDGHAQKIGFEAAPPVSVVAGKLLLEASYVHFLARIVKAQVLFDGLLHLRSERFEEVAYQIDVIVVVLDGAVAGDHRGCADGFEFRESLDPVREVGIKNVRGGVDQKIARHYHLGVRNVNHGVAARISAPQKLELDFAF